MTLIYMSFRISDVRLHDKLYVSIDDCCNHSVFELKLCIRRLWGD